MKSMHRRAAWLLGSVLVAFAAAGSASADWYGQYVYTPEMYASLYDIAVPTVWIEEFQHPDNPAYYMRVTTNIYDRTHVHNYTWDVHTPNQAGVWIQADARCYDSDGGKGWYYQWRTSGMALKKQGEQVYATCPYYSDMLYGRGWIWAW